MVGLRVDLNPGFVKVGYCNGMRGWVKKRKKSRSIARWPSLSNWVGFTVLKLWSDICKHC